jgi:hypothetical protein
MNVPSIQLSGKTTVLRLSWEETRHHLRSKQAAVANDECTSMGEPADGFMVCFICKNGHETLGKDVLAIIITVFFLFYFRLSFLQLGSGIASLFRTHCID